MRPRFLRQLILMVVIGAGPFFLLGPMRADDDEGGYDSGEASIAVVVPLGPDAALVIPLGPDDSDDQEDPAIPVHGKPEDPK